MRLATVRRGGTTVAVRLDGDEAVDVPGALDVGELLGDPQWRERALAASGVRTPVSELDFAPVIPRPDKIVCVGLNYRNHILEMGNELPAYPTLFAKFRGALIGAHDDIALDRAVERLDWEAELAVIIGSRARRVAENDAASVIAGFTVCNDVSARDWQGRTLQWLQGKTFEHSTPLGPWLVTTDEFDGTDAQIICEVNGETMQCANIADLLFKPPALVAYISSVITLEPGDVISTGTPGGVGQGRQPPRFLATGDVVTTRIEGIGECTNTCREA